MKAYKDIKGFKTLKANPVEVKVPSAAIVGSLTVNNTVVSGFSASNYIKISDKFDVTGGKTWEMVFKVKTGENITTLGAILGHIGSDNNDPIDIGVKNSTFIFSLADSINGNMITGITGTYAVQPNTTYWVKMSFDGNTYVLSYSPDGENYTEDIRYTSTKSIYASSLVMGRQQGSASEYPWLGSVDLSGCYINIEGSRWWTGAKSVTKYKYYTVGG